MSDILRGAGNHKRFSMFLGWALLVLSPWLLLAAISVATGKNSLLSYPVWTDELDYWRSLFSWIHVGFPAGYNGIAEYPAAMGTLSVHGLAPILLYGEMSRLLGLEHYSIVLFNALWFSAAAVVFCAVVRPKAGVSMLLAALFSCFMPAVLYAATSMTELFNYAALLLYATFLIGAEKTGRGWNSLLCWVWVVFACTYRITYFVLFIPLIAVNCRFRFSRKTVWLGFLSAVLTGITYAISTAYTAPFPGGFLHQWLQQGDMGLSFRMFLSHAKSNLNDYFLRATDSPMEDALRRMYCLAMVWTLFGAFIRWERAHKRRRLRFGFGKEYLGCFLLLFLPFAVVVMIYETNDWSDFRALAPFLWGVAALLSLRKKRAFPVAVLAGNIALLIWLAFLEPVGAYRDDYRFTAQPYRDEIREACELITYDPDAEDPYANSIRADLINFQVLSEVDPAMGFLTGWFTPQNTGKSRWILTDHLKILVEGYETRFGKPGVNVYRKENSQNP